MMVMEPQTQPAQMINPVPKKSFFSRLKLSWANIWSWLGVIVLLFVSYSLVNLFLLNPYQSPEDIRVTNVTSRSATISWITEKASAGAVIYGEENSFKPSVLASLGEKIAYDDRDVAKAVLEGSAKLEADLEERDSVITSGELEKDIKVSSLGKYNVHHVTIKDLDPQKDYFFMVGDGVRFSDGEGVFADDAFTLSKSNSLKTFAETEELEQPNPTYGKIVLEGDENVVVDDALVFLRPGGSQSIAAPLSASVNEDGNWYIDFSNSTNIDGTISLSFDEDFDDHEVFVEGGKFGASGVRQEPMSVDAPMFDIEVSGPKESSLLRNILSRFVGVVDANSCKCEDNGCGVGKGVTGTTGNCYRIMCPDGRAIMWDSNDRAVCTGTAIVTKVAPPQEPAPGSNTTATVGSSGGASKSLCWGPSGDPIAGITAETACKKSGGSWSESPTTQKPPIAVPGSTPVPGAAIPGSPSNLATGVCVIDGTVRGSGLTEQECRNRGSGRSYEWKAGSQVSAGGNNTSSDDSDKSSNTGSQNSVNNSNPDGGFCNPIGKVIVSNGATFICTRAQRGATYVKVVDQKDPAVTLNYCKHNSSLTVTTTTDSSCPENFTRTGQIENMQMCGAEGGCLCPNGRRVSKGGYCDNRSAPAMLEIGHGSVCPDGKDCFCPNGQKRDLSAGEVCEAPLPPVGVGRKCDSVECRCSIPVLQGSVVSEYKRFVVKNGELCSRDLLNLKKNSFSKEVFAQTSVTISPSAGVFAVEENGVYCADVKDDPYCFDVTESGSKALYIDVNGNGTQDEGDTDLAVEGITLSLEERRNSYSIKSGFNLVSFDYVDNSIGTTAKDWLNYLNAAYDDSFYSIAKFDSGKWVVIGNRDGETYGSDNFQVLPGEGYLLKSKHDMVLRLGGKAVIDSVPISLKPGWNLIGLAGTKKAYTAETLISNVNSTAGVIVDNVTKYESGLGRYVGLQKEVNAVYGVDYPLVKTSGYFLRVKDGTGVWTP